jgi:hypothetical protein
MPGTRESLHGRCERNRSMKGKTMSTLRALASTVSGRPGQAAVAIALILNASAAFAEGKRAEGRRLTNRALTVQARLHDAPQDDTVLTADERTELRRIASEIRAARPRSVGKPTPASFDNAVAIDLIGAAGMVSRRRADADVTLRMALTFTERKVAEDALETTVRDLTGHGFPLIRLDDPSPMRFEPI